MRRRRAAGSRVERDPVVDLGGARLAVLVQEPPEVHVRVGVVGLELHGAAVRVARVGRGGGLDVAPRRYQSAAVSFSPSLRAASAALRAWGAAAVATSATAKSKSAWPDSGFHTDAPSRATTRLPSAAILTPVIARPSGSCALRRFSERRIVAAGTSASARPLAVRRRTRSWNESRRSRGRVEAEPLRPRENARERDRRACWPHREPNSHSQRGDCWGRRGEMPLLKVSRPSSSPVSAFLP